ncbi:MAG: NAD(P)/FAD-dependent oxidoreductase [Streptosporangiales bacterium]|nr:NAD(P)/FAD-dependent oxidoreductase [Streptosporangiales bacterium]
MTEPASAAGLAGATDDQLRDAAAHADPMALRGLLYQLTGDEEAAATRVTGQSGIDASRPASEEDIALLRAKAFAFLKNLRDSGGTPGAGGIGPLDRLPRSLALAAGVPEVPAEDLPLWLEEFALDPYARGLDWNGPRPGRADGFGVIVIGAGMGGLNAAVQLKHAGIAFTVLEKNAGVGGTWFENRYPGARVDSASRAYAHIFGVDFVFSGPYCAREENQRYFDWIADSFGIRNSIVFGTEVVSLTWDENGSAWEILAKGPEGQRTWRANAVISAVGLLSRPNVPALPGAGDFRGPAFHSARWPDGLGHEGKRVGVIGTGCSGVQMVPELARKAAHVSVFQRTPQWLFDRPGYLDPFPEQVTWLDRNLPYYANFLRFRANWLASPYLSEPVRVIDPEFRDPHARSAVNKRLRDDRIAFIRRKLGHRPDLAAAMIPPHPPFSARPVQVDTDYCFYDALLRDNVTLVTDGIERVTETGIATRDGARHDLDLIVYATGFRANECLWPMEVRGRGGRTVGDLWAPDGPRAYAGVMMPGFPNLFLIYGPNMNSYGGLGVINLQEMAARYALLCVGRLVERGERAVDVSPDAYRRYNAELDEREAIKIYSDPRARSYYRNASGRSAVNCPFTGTEMWHRLREPDFGGDLAVS